MSNKATEFFGIDFGAAEISEPAPVKPKVEAPKAKGPPKSAAEFFGIDFQTKEAKPQRASPVQGNEWDQINRAYKAGKEERDATQLTILQQELAKETDPTNKEALKREISRVNKKGS